MVEYSRPGALSSGTGFAGLYSPTAMVYAVRVTATETHRAIEAVWRIESARLIAGLARIVRDVGVAEELAQDALVVALKQWPESGVPDNPGAWLMATAKHRAIDLFRRKRMLERKHEELGREIEVDHALNAPDIDAALDDDIGDDLLRLMFTACHPILSTEARVALTLRLIGGLTTDEIARAFLVAEPTIAQRIVRAKRTLADARRSLRDAARPPTAPPVSLPSSRSSISSSTKATPPPQAKTGCARSSARRRCASVASSPASRPRRPRSTASSPSWRSRPRVSAPAPGRRASRCCSSTRTAGAGTGCSSAADLPALARAEALGAPGPYVLQAAIAACHARALTPEETDWPRIAALYATLAAMVPSPVVELNRAVAVAMAFGPAEGLALVDALVAEPSLKGYHLLPGVRGDLLAKLGRLDEARTEFERAASLTRNSRERDVLLARAAACTEGAGSSA